MNDTGDSEPTLYRETAQDVSLDRDADNYPQEYGHEEPDSDLEDDDSFDLEGLDSDNKVDMNIIYQNTSLHNLHHIEQLTILQLQ